MDKAKTIVITGASRGIGATLAQDFAAPKVTLGLIARNADALDSIAQACRNKGAMVITGLIDVTDRSQLQQWLSDFDEQHPVDLLIANAGITNIIHDKQLNEEAETSQRLIEVNTLGVIYTIDALAEKMLKRQRGQIAIMSSLSAYYGMPVTPGYCASKAAVKSYGEAMRGWLKPHKVKVNIICPGFIQSDMTDSFSAPKPFMISAETASRKIRQGLLRDKAIISFPFPLNWGMRLISMMPFWLASFFLGLSGYNRKK